jgi:hypothetical protein
MVCMGPDSRLIGFALTGKCTAERAALTKQLTGRLA